MVRLLSPLGKPHQALLEDTSKVVFSATHGNMSVEYTN